MNKPQGQTVNMLVRTKQFETEHPVTPPIARATVLFTRVDSLIVDFHAAGASQAGGIGEFRGGSTERKLLRQQILTVLGEMTAIARGLDPAVHPGIADRFRPGLSRRNYQGLIDTGAAFVAAVGEAPVKALFVERGFAADFDTQLTASLASFATATGHKFDGQRGLKEGTVSLNLLTKQTTQVMKELRAVMRKHLRKNAPQLLEVWNAATRVYRSTAEQPAAPAGTTPNVSPAPAN